VLHFYHQPPADVSILPTTQFSGSRKATGSVSVCLCFQTLMFASDGYRCWYFACWFSYSERRVVNWSSKFKVDWMIDWYLISHVTNLHVNSGNRQCMQCSDKNEHKRIKDITCTDKDNVVQMTFYSSQSHIWAVHICVLWLWGSDYKI